MTIDGAPETIDEYISLVDEKWQPLLEKVRKTINDAAPEAIEKMSWQMPTFYYKENLVHFALAKKHLGFYPGASGVAAFTDMLGEYKYGKGSIQFPLEKPIPFELISEITKFRVMESQNKIRK